METFQSKVATDMGILYARVSDLSEDRAQSKASSVDPMPEANSLPDMEPQNPWHSARFAPVAGDMLYLEGLGSRPITDFERFPPHADLLFCYVRLSHEAALREDKVPQETVLYPRDQAQRCFFSLASGLFGLRTCSAARQTPTESPRH